MFELEPPYPENVDPELYEHSEGEEDFGAEE